MKKTFVLLVFTLILMLSFQNLNAQVLQNITCTGYNQDVVANGSSTSMASTTIDCDGSGYVFLDGTFDPGSGACATSNIWPAGLTISSLITNGLTYTLQPPTGNNDLVLWDNATGALTLSTPVVATNLYVLYTSGGASGTASVSITFTDNTTQLISSISTTNWCSGSSPATAVFNRTARSTSTTCSISTCQYMYEMSLAIDVANQSKSVQSISFTNSNGSVLNIFAVGGNVTSSGGTTPVIPNQSSTICSGSLFNATPVNNPPTTVVPAGTTYSWPTPIVTGGITGGSASSGNISSISATLVNPSTSVQTATYTVTPTAGSLVGSPFTVIVTVNPIPATPVITKNGSILTSSATSGNHWYNLATGIIASATAQTYTPIQNGSYFVIVVANGCISDSSNIINITGVGINEIVNNINLNVYPNPTSNELFLELKGNKEQKTFELINSTGQLVYSGKLNDKTILNTSNLTPGVYLIKLFNGKSYELKKIIKE